MEPAEPNNQKPNQKRMDRWALTREHAAIEKAAERIKGEVLNAREADLKGGYALPPRIADPTAAIRGVFNNGLSAPPAAIGGAMRAFASMPSAFALADRGYFSQNKNAAEAAAALTSEKMIMGAPFGIHPAILAMKQSAEKVESFNSAVTARAKEFEKIVATQKALAVPEAFASIAYNPSSLAPVFKGEIVHGELLPTMASRRSAVEIKPMTQESAKVIPVNPAVETNMLLRRLTDVVQSGFSDICDQISGLREDLSEVSENVSGTNDLVRDIGHRIDRIDQATSAIYSDSNTVAKAVKQAVFPEEPTLDMDESRDED